MTAVSLLKHFDRIAEAPNAIPRLRRFILDLAVRGKLVEQDPSDEPVDELLKRIEAGKEILIKNRKMKKLGALPDFTNFKEPFPIPNTWRWIRLGNVIQLISGQHLKPNEYTDQNQTGLPYITGPSDFGNNGLVITRHALIRKAVARKGQILLTVKGAGVGKTSICDIEEVAISRQLMAMTPLKWHHGFLLIITHLLAESLKESARSLIPGIAREDVILFASPFAPLPEQYRIVAKVDELMELCDELEAEQTKRERRRDRLVAATLNGLNNGEANPEPGAHSSFKESTRFYFNHLPRLTTRHEHIQQLRQTILNLAIRGKLTSNSSYDESSLRGLNQIQSQDYDYTKITKTTPPNNKILVDEFPFKIPETWKWVSVSEVAQTRLGKMLDKAKNKGKPQKYLRNINVRWFDFELSNLIKMRFEDHEIEEFSLRWGDVLICEGGEPGRAAVWEQHNSSILFQKAIHRVRLSADVHPRYFLFALRHDAISGRLAQFFTGTGIKHLTGKGLNKYSFSLPPLEEQQRIVIITTELLSICDELDKQLYNKKDALSKYIETILSKMTVK